ncbi:MAG: hypothetical protein IJU16_07130, partial [Clostridia bacterium]|nr:hypothetical protein [Clostridia bacterium]
MFLWKRIGMMLLAVCVLLQMPIIVSAARAENVTFSLSAAGDTSTGSTVTISWNVSENSYFSNCTVYVYYNPKLVEFLDYDSGSNAPSGSMFMAADHKDELFVKGAFVHIKGIQTSGELAQFMFRVLDDSKPAEFSLAMDECEGLDPPDSENAFDISYTLTGVVINSKEPAVTTVPSSSPAKPAASTTK